MPRGRVHDQAEGSSQLEQVVPLLLHDGHLTALARLACFCSSKGMAELVLRHAAGTHLTLTLPDPAQAASSSHATAAQQLAAQSHNVKLAVHGGLLTPASCLWQRITTIQLHNMQLDQTSPCQLQLHRLPHLHTLSLRQCGLTSNISSIAMQQQHRSTSAHTFECLSGHHDLAPNAILDWIDPSQLQTLITDRTTVTTLLPQLPALQELRFSLRASRVEDEGFEQLLAHPRLARVWLTTATLRGSHADKPCTWQSLHVLKGVYLISLGVMPLASMQSCTVQGWMYLVEPDEDEYDSDMGGAPDLQTLIDNVSRAQHLVFQADSCNTACCWTPAEPSFGVFFDFESNFAESEYYPRLITLVTQHLAPGTALVLHRLRTFSPEVVASLAAASATLTTLCFYDCETYTDVEHTGVGMLAHMPHVSHAVVVTPDTFHPSWHTKIWLLQLRLVVTGVTRPLRLTLVAPSKQQPPWELGAQMGIRQWVATHANENVSVEFQQLKG